MSSKMHWSEMNCIQNPTLQITSNFFLSDQGPPAPKIPPNIICQIYHPTSLEGGTAIPLSNSMEKKIQKFINEHNRTDTNNITELGDSACARLLTTPTVIAVLSEKDIIIGTMFSVIFRVRLIQ